MLTKKITFLIAFCSVLTLASTAYAWGPEGHKIVARIAENHLNPSTRAQVQQLLADFKDDEPTLVGVSSWADENRSRETAREHFINLDENCHFSPEFCPDGSCAVGAIKRYYTLLKDTSNSHETRQNALVMLVHIAGDIHQPLHAWGGDKGGNDYQVRFGNRGTNLHHVWDSLLIEADDRNWEDMAARLSRRDTLPDNVYKRPIEEWAEESCRVAATPGFFPGRNIDESYAERWRPALEDRLTIAGQRLAAILNSALP